ncbi:MAG: hypothetical protein JST54_12205 [Deltaproteobacteria bacterium]|nr:hypothetical protein [Deltaproteobacteria bacterium]
MTDRDYVQRMIERLGSFLARLAGLRQEGELDRALREVDDAIPQLLGIDLGLLESVDARTAAKLLGSKERAEVLARILAEKVELLKAANRHEEAEKLRHRISALQLASDQRT